jgi:hypothetical protein
MNILAEELESLSKEKELFVVYQEEENIELTIPFTGKNGINKNDKLIIGNNFIENKLIALEKNKIIGINWYTSDQEKSLNTYKSIINKKIELYDNLINNLNHHYDNDRKYIIYSDSIESLFMIPFNVKSINDLESSENIEMRITQFKSAINLSVIKAKEIVDEEAKEYIDGNNLGTLEEIQAIKEIIDESVDSIDYTDVRTPKELILNCWPVILTPNPFIVNV